MTDNAAAGDGGHHCGQAAGTVHKQVLNRPSPAVGERHAATRC
ncbi:hypothetical protein ACIBQ0_10680 [Nocardia nova]